MAKDWRDILTTVGRNNTALAKAAPDAMKAFAGLAGAATADGAIDKKTKELMAVAISICIRCDGCIAYHAHSAIRAGATREEMVETIALAVEMGGGPSTVYGADALQAYDQLSS
ncbi:MAG: carboxymuconolactone decarboxylase family protein [Alphaproteobacteria bacterium]|nr:carboxymuconolactone decarboxylase family protein [Alphaproteobacteria bacterium]